MRYEPPMNERAAPRAARAAIALPWTESSPGVGDSGEVRSRQTAELDIWEDEGGATSGTQPGILAGKLTPRLTGLANGTAASCRFDD